MKNTVSLTINNRFRQLYNKGKSQVAPTLVVYFGKNRDKNKTNRLGITTSVKLGGAVTRNAVRRKIKEVYRLNEAQFEHGIDIIVVARVRGTTATFAQIQRDMMSCAKTLGILAAPPTQKK